MKKYRHIALGIVLGMGLSFAFGAHAEVINMIGKTIDGAFSVKLDGKELDNQAIVVEGTSYLPVRAVGEAIGYNVGFDADLGISLTKSVTDVTYADEPIVTPTKPELTAEKRAKQIREIDYELTNIRNAIPSYEKMIEYNKSKSQSYDNIQKSIDELNIKITNLEAQKAELIQ